MLQLNAAKHVKIGPKRRGDKKLPVEFISVYGKKAIPILVTDFQFDFLGINLNPVDRIGVLRSGIQKFWEFDLP